jgi:serine O-acetyltransferase
VPPGARVFARPSKPLLREKVTKEEFLPYGTPGDDIPDPVGRALNGLVEEVGRLRARVEELEQELAKEREEPTLKKVSG